MAQCGPKGTEPHSITVKGKHYHCCIHHQYWCSHTPTVCNNKKLDKEHEITAALAKLGIEDIAYEDKSDRSHE